MARQWYLAGEGANFDSLEALMADHELKKGDLIRCEMKLTMPYAQAFDVLPNSWWPFVPEGLQVRDIWGTGWPVPWSANYGYVEMEADPAWLWAVLAFMRAHWLAIVIAGFVLYMIVSKVSVWMFTDLGEPPSPTPSDEEKWYEDPAWIAVGGGALIFVIGIGAYLSRRRSLPK